MGLFNWFSDLETYKKATVLGGGCVVLCGMTYGLYKFYSCRRKVALYDESPNNGKEERPAIQKRVLVLGLQGCGKTTFLTALTNLGSGIGGNEIKPTEGFNVMCVTTNGVLLNIWEIGGSEKVQNYWTKFTANTNLLIYIVDSTDVEHFLQGKDKLYQLLKDPCLDGIPLILLASKQDKTGARSLNVIQKYFDIESLSKSRKTECFGIQISLRGPELQGIECVQNAIVKLCSQD